ncbi:DUF3043 domain-containing protein [Corynebacterium imitans]|uniref:DUF3043 domain-containing protein n=1 Tax=Corynebacterium imitans TaxID=156978 RepID=UPI001EF24143|nr:DUF3043 domain-containing protein [Corynebacterium imitans]
MKFPWQKSEQNTEQQAEAGAVDDGTSISEAQPEPTYPKGYTPPKGRPTPKRHEQEIKRGVIRDPDALTPAQRSQRNKDLKASMTKEEWKAYKKEQRAENRRANREIQARIDAGDERYLMDRDKGEIRRYVRDWVDARRFFNNYVMPVALVLLLVMLIGTWMPRVATVLSGLTMVFILAIFIEAFIIGIRANKAVRAKFPETTETGFGLGMYAFSRASQPRNWRSPKPQVAIGAKV